MHKINIHPVWTDFEQFICLFVYFLQKWNPVNNLCIEPNPSLHLRERFVAVCFITILISAEECNSDHTFFSAALVFNIFSFSFSHDFKNDSSKSPCVMCYRLPNCALWILCEHFWDSLLWPWSVPRPWEHQSFSSSCQVFWSGVLAALILGDCDLKHQVIKLFTSVNL